jgi:hypothetical protein
MRKKQLTHNVLKIIKFTFASTLLISLLMFVAFNTKKYYDKAIYIGQTTTTKLARVIFEIANHSKDSSTNRFSSIDEEWLSIKRELEENARINKRLAKQNDEEDDEENGLLLISESRINNSSTKRKRCPKVPPLLSGPVLVSSLPTPFDAFQEDIKLEYSKLLTLGGKYEPDECVARHRVAIVVPYKNRLNNLNYFLNHMHPFLQKQQLAYQIFVVEQYNENLFNKGVLMNAGFLEIINSYERRDSLVNRANYSAMPFDCVVFHDVDLLPEDDRIMYSCPKYRPRHLSVAIDKFRYKMAYFKLVGRDISLKAAT